MLVTKRTRVKIVFSFFTVMILLAMLVLVEKYNPAALEYKIAKLQRIGDIQTDLAIEDRIGEAKQCYSLFQDSPFIGKGVGYTYHLFRQYAKGFGANVILETNFTHSDIMFMLSKFGVIGIALFLWFYFTMCKAFLACMEKSLHSGSTGKRFDSASSC